MLQYTRLNIYANNHLVYFENIFVVGMAMKYGRNDGFCPWKDLLELFCEYAGLGVNMI
jgi:hypothetical protein